MPQFARPNGLAGSTGGSWAGTWQDIDETVPEDTGRVVSPLASAWSWGATFSAVTDPQNHAGHILRCRCRLFSDTTTLTLELRRTSDGAVLATRTMVDIEFDFITFEFELTPTEAGTLTAAEYAGGWALWVVYSGASGTGSVSWEEMQIPDLLEATNVGGIASGAQVFAPAADRAALDVGGIASGAQIFAPSADRAAFDVGGIASGAAVFPPEAIGPRAVDAPFLSSTAAAFGPEAESWAGSSVGTDLEAGLVWLLDLEPILRDTGAVEVFRLSDVGYTSLPTDTPARAIWETGLAGPPELSQSLADGRALGGEVQADPGSVRIHRSPGRLAWADARRYAWRNARALVRVGYAGAPLATFTTLLDGVVTRPPTATDALVFDLSDASGPLDDPYLGSGDRLLGMGHALRVGTGAIVQLRATANLGAGFAARLMLRPSSLHSTRFGAGLMTLLRNWSASTGMWLRLVPTGPAPLFAADLELLLPGVTPASFLVPRTWERDRWVAIAVNYHPGSGVVQLAIGSESIETWAVTGAPVESASPLRVGWENTADDYDVAHVQWVAGGLDPEDFSPWLTQPVPRDVGLAHYWWPLGDGAGQPQDVGPSKEHAILPTDGTARWVHSEEGGVDQADAVRYVPLGGPVENVTSLLLDPNRFVYLASARSDARVLAVYSNAGPLVESPIDYQRWTFTMVDADTGSSRVKLDGSGGREIADGDFLLYEVHWDGQTLTTDVGGGSIAIGPESMISVQLVFTDGARTAVTGGSDQHGLSILPGTDLSEIASSLWYLRLISLAAYVGKTIDWVEVQCVDPADASGFEDREARGWIRRVEVTDAIGVLRQEIWAPRQGAPATTLVAESHAGNDYTVEGPVGDWVREGQYNFALFNDPQETTITHDVRGEAAVGATPIAIAKALLAELGFALDTATIAALEAELTVIETLGVATDDHEILNLTPTNLAVRPEQNVDEDPDREDADWLTADDDTGVTRFTPYYELPHGPFAAGEGSTVELLVRRSNAAVAEAPKLTVAVEQPKGNAILFPSLFAAIPMDGAGVARMSLPFEAAQLDFTQPIVTRIDGSPVTAGGQFSTVELGAVQLRVVRAIHQVALLVDDDRSVRDILNELLLSAGLQWGLDRLRRFTVSRLEDPDDVLGADVGELFTAARFTMVDEADAEYRISLWTGTETIVASSVLTYPLLWRPEPGLEPASVAVDLVFDDASTLAASALTDDLGLGVDPRADLSEVAGGRWYPRRIPLEALAGRILERVDLVCRKENGGAARAWLGWVALKTAGSGAVQRSLWTGDGDATFLSSSDPAQTGIVEPTFARAVTADLEAGEDDVVSLVPLESDPPIWAEVAEYRENHTVLDNVVTTATPERRLFLAETFRLERRRRLEVLADYPDAIEGGTVHTVLVHAAAAQALLDRRAAFFGQPNRGFDVTLLADSAATFLARLDTARVGGSCWFVHPDHDLFFGEAFRIIRVVFRDALLTLTLWRPR